MTSPKAKVRGKLWSGRRREHSLVIREKLNSHQLNKAVSKVFGFFACFPLGSGKSAASQVLGMAGSLVE